MSADGWTPTTEQVRSGYMLDPEWDHSGPPSRPECEQLGRAFDRWLEQERRAQFEAGVAAAREAVEKVSEDWSDEDRVLLLDVIDALHEGGQA